MQYTIRYTFLSQVKAFIYIAPYTIQIFSKLPCSDQQENYSIYVAEYINYDALGVCAQKKSACLTTA